MTERHTFSDSLTPITCHAWNKDRTQIALSPNNHEVHIYQRSGNEWKLVEILNQHDLRVMGIDWGRTTNRIVTCAVDRNAYVWTQGDDGKWKPMLVLLRINRAATCVKWSPLENKFAAGSGDRLVSVSYFESGNDWWVSKHIKKPIRSTVTCIDWHPNNSLLVAGSTDYKVRIFSGYIKDIEEQPSANSWGNRMPFGQLLAEFQNTISGGGWIHNVSFSYDGCRICWVGHDSSINIADSNSGNAVAKIKTEYLPFLCCEWITPNSVVVAGHSCIPLIYTLDVNSNKLILTAKLDQTQKKESSNISAMRIFQSLDRHLRSENTDISLDSIHQNAISCMRIHNGDRNSCKRISTSGLDGQLVIWDINTTNLTKSMQGLKI